MVLLAHPHDYVHLFLYSASFGAVGGLAYALLQVSSADSGFLALPWIHRGRVGLGFFASVIVGAIAAMAVSYFFTPEALVKATVNGKQVIQTKWQIVKVIPLSIIVGSAGGAFLDAMRGRVLAELNAQKVVATQAAGKTAVKQIAEAAKTSATATVAAVSDNIGTALEAAVEKTPPSLADGLQELQADGATGDQIKKLLNEHPSAGIEEHPAEIGDLISSAIEKGSTDAAIEKHLDLALASIDEAAES